MTHQRRYFIAIPILMLLCGTMFAVSLRSGSPVLAQGSGYSLRFYGNGFDDIDRVKIQIDDPSNSDPGPAADLGANDFTLEFWMKASASDNLAGEVSCGPGEDNWSWIFGNIVFDRDRFNYGRKYGLSIAGGVFVFGIRAEGSDLQTICGTTDVLDQEWHHIAVERRRSDGWMWLFVDGNLEAQANGPDGDVSYPDDATPSTRQDIYCQGPAGSWNGICENDPYLVIGAEKHDAGADDGSGNYPSYSGWIDEVRLSNALRYTSNFTPPSAEFSTDSETAALYHFDEGPIGACTGTVLDSSGASAGPSNGNCNFGGSPAGPIYSSDTPFGGQAPKDPPNFVGSPDAAPLARSAIIRWQTDIQSDSQARYRSGNSCGPPWTEVLTDSVQVINHVMILSDLSTNTDYCYQVQSSNAVGATLWSSDQTVTTLFGEWSLYLPIFLKW